MKVYNQEHTIILYVLTRTYLHVPTYTGTRYMWFIVVYYYK
jgi:hypothetical protein